MKRTLILMLALCMLLPALLACGKKDEQPKDTTGSTGSADVTTAVTEEPNPFPDIDFEGEEINILLSAEMKDYCFAEEEGLSAVSDAVYYAYEAVREKYNVDFVVDFESTQGKNTAKFNARVQNSTLTGYKKGYDLVMGQMHSINLAAQGCFKNLAKSEKLHLDADYYYHEINKSSEIEGQLYAVAGAYNMDKVSMAIVYFFNKTLHSDVFGNTEYTDLYQMVRDKKWTQEVLGEMTAQVASENGDGEWNEKDRYGMIGVNTGLAAMVASGITSVMQKDDGTYDISFYDEHLTTVFSVYKDLFAKDYNRVSTSYKDEPIFTSGNSLFYTSHVNRLGVMNGIASFKIGVLPFPLFSEAQQDYRTNVNRSEMIFVPINADLDISATILDYMNYIFLEDVVTAYWDQSLASRFAAEPADTEMLELARSAVYEDFGLTYTSRLSYFYAVAGEKLINGDELTDWWKGIETSVQTQLGELIKEYQELASKNY